MCVTSACAMLHPFALALPEAEQADWEFQSTFCASALEGVGGGSREASPYPDYYIGTCIARTWAQTWWSRVFADTNCRWSDLAPRQQFHTATMDSLLAK